MGEMLFVILTYLSCRVKYPRLLSSRANEVGEKLLDFYVANRSGKWKNSGSISLTRQLSVAYFLSL